MHIHYLQHVPFEGLGHIAEWARLQNHSVTSTPLYDQAPLPDPATFDSLVIMGGPMGVHDTSEYAWLTWEKHFIEQALGLNKKVLGICLGAQLIADVLGARVFPNGKKEIGWYPLTRTASVQDTPWSAVVPEQFQAFHWHGDTFDLPAGAIHLAESTACRHQGFYCPEGALGLQFHLESTRESIELLIDNCGHELTPATHVQSADDIRSHSGAITASNALMDAMLDHFLGSGSK